METSTTRRSLKEKQRQEREDLILQAAEEVLMEKGYHETSMDEIAARVGIAKGTVYLHFPSKEDLVIALFGRELQKVFQLIEHTMASTLTPRAKLEAILQSMYSGIFSARFRLLYTLSSNTDLRKIFLEKKGDLRDLWQKLSTGITSLLEDGKAANEFDTTLPTTVMLNAFFSLLSPQLSKHLIVEEQIPPEELVKHLSRLYFKGIAAV